MILTLGDIVVFMEARGTFSVLTARTSQHFGDGLQQDSQVQEDIPVLDVLKVKQNIFFKGRVMTSGHLPETRKPRCDIEASKMLQVIFFEIIFRMRARPNDAHIPLQNVK